MWFKKEKDISEFKYRVFLNIQVLVGDLLRTNGISYRCSDNKTMNSPEFRRFIKWYHGRKQSQTYVLKWDGGERSYQRKYIIGYEIISEKL